MTAAHRQHARAPTAPRPRTTTRQAAALVGKLETRLGSNLLKRLTELQAAAGEAPELAADTCAACRLRPHGLCLGRRHRRGCRSLVLHGLAPATSTHTTTTTTTPTPTHPTPPHTPTHSASLGALQADLDHAASTLQEVEGRAAALEAKADQLAKQVRCARVGVGGCAALEGCVECCGEYWGDGARSLPATPPHPPPHTPPHTVPTHDSVCPHCCCHHAPRATQMRELSASCQALRDAAATSSAAASEEGRAAAALDGRQAQLVGRCEDLGRRIRELGSLSAEAFDKYKGKGQKVRDCPRRGDAACRVCPCVPEWCPLGVCAARGGGPGAPPPPPPPPTPRAGAARRAAQGAGRAGGLQPREQKGAGPVCQLHGAAGRVPQAPGRGRAVGCALRAAAVSASAWRALGSWARAAPPPPPPPLCVRCARTRA
jgi:hypothetical protein